jgi:hypothetical protein
MHYLERVWSVVAGAFQITFCTKIHVNNVFSFLKNYFWHQHIKTIQNVQTILNFSTKKKLKFFGNAAAAAFPNIPLVIIDLRYFTLALILNNFQC